MSKWQAMRDRKTIHDFPCPREGWAEGEFLRRCYPELEKCGLDGECSYEFAYRQYIALRAVVEAELSRATPQGLASAYRTFSTVTELPKWQKGQAIKRADAWKGLT